MRQRQRRGESRPTDPSMRLEHWDKTAKVTFDKRMLSELVRLRFLRERTREGPHAVREVHRRQRLPAGHRHGRIRVRESSRRGMVRVRPRLGPAGERVRGGHDPRIVPRTIRPVLRRFSFVEVQETPEPLATADVAVRSGSFARSTRSASGTSSHSASVWSAARPETEGRWPWAGLALGDHRLRLSDAGDHCYIV
jgi:hypothetical protein